MRVRDVPLMLVGSRGAILVVARSRWALAVGAVLVFTASISRNYDGADLLREPGVLLHGIVVSTVNALVLFTIVYGAAWAHGLERPRYVRGALSFLGVFWMTAPMAWVYAIPVERFLGPVEAVGANGWLLAGVSLWRVALITRVLQVLWGASYLKLLSIVMMFADAVLLLGVSLAPAPVVDFMGGMQHSPAEQALASLNFMVGCFGVVSAPVWIVGALIAMAKLKGGWRAGVAEGGVSKAFIPALALVLLALVPLLMWAQPEQARRWRAESLLVSGQVREGMEELSRHERADYPPAWDPPPRLGHRDGVPTMEQVRGALVEPGLSGWVRAVYLGKSRRQLLQELWVHRDVAPGEFLPIDKLRLATRELDGPLREAIGFHIEFDEQLSPEERAALRELLERSENDADDAR